jgi:hypothetical protein
VSRNDITVIEGIFSAASVWSCIDVEPKTVACVQECYYVFRTELRQFDSFFWLADEQRRESD